MQRKHKIKQFYGQVVRRPYKKGIHTDTYYYVDKGSHKRTTRAAWDNWKKFYNEPRIESDVHPEELFTFVESDNEEGLQYHVQSMPNVIKETLFKAKHKQVYAIDSRGQKHRITKGNNYKLDLLQKQYIKDQAEYFKGDTSRLSAKEAKEVNDNAYRNVFYNVFVEGWTNESASVIYLDYSFLNFYDMQKYL